MAQSLRSTRERIQTPLPTIREEGSGTRSDVWETSNNPNVISTYRAAARANHTKLINKIQTELTQPITTERAKHLRAALVRCFGDIEARHDRLIQFTPEESLDDEEQWLKAADVAHQSALAQLNAVPSMYDAREPSITGSRRSGGSHRSVSSTLSKLREAELDLQQSKLQMEQELTEEEYRREEQSQLDRIELARKKRQLQNELDQKALRASTLQAQAADLLEDEEDDDAGSFRGWSGLNSNLTSSAPNINTSSSMIINTPLRPPSRSFMNTPFMKQIRGFGDRVIKAMTPRHTNSVVDGLAPQASSYSSSTTIPNRTNLNAISSAPGQALFGAPPPLINSRPVVTTSTTASTLPPPARPPPTQPPPVTAGSALFGAPPPSSGPATYSTPNPFTSHGPVVFGAPPVSSISTIYNRPPPPVSSGPAVFGAPPRNHTPPPFTAEQALFGAPSSTHIQQRTSWSATPSPTNPFIGCTTAPDVDPFIPDEWINNITANAPAIRNGIRPPKLDLPYFDGNPMDYPMFIQSFKLGNFFFKFDETWRGYIFYPSLHCVLTPLFSE